MSIISTIKKIIGIKTAPITGSSSTFTVSQSNYAQPTGGMSTPTGGVLVTPSGDIVGTAEPPKPTSGRGGSRGGGGSSYVGGGQLDLTTAEAIKQDIQEIQRRQGKGGSLSNIQKFEASQQDLYGSLISNEVRNKIRDVRGWDDKSSQERRKLYNQFYDESYNKANEGYSKSVGTYKLDVEEREIKKQYPDYEVVPMSTSKGTSYTLIEKNKAKETIEQEKKETGSIKSLINLGEDLLGAYEKAETKVSGSLKKWWNSRIEQFEKEFKKNPDLYSNELKENIKSAREKLEKGKGLTSLEQQIINTPIKTIIELGIASYLSPTLTTAGVGTAQQPQLPKKISDIGIKISDFGEDLSKIKDLDAKNIGRVINIGGKAVQGASTLIPETSEDILTYALFEKALKSKLVPKLIKSLGLKTLGTYEGYSGLTESDLTSQERYGKFLVSGLSFAGGIPEDVVLFRKLRYKLGGTEKTKIGEFGIQETKLDLGKTEIKGKKPTQLELEMALDPVALEFIPSQKETFTKRLDILDTLSKEIPLKDNFKLPNIKDLQQRKILDIVKQNDDIITGSFSQEVIVKNSRKWKTDLDIISRNPLKTLTDIKKELGNDISINFGKVAWIIKNKRTGKELANVIDYELGEAGYSQLFNPIKVKGINLLPPEARLVSKAYQQTIPTFKEKRAKILKDIAQLTGRSELERNPALLRGYGLTKKQQEALFKGQELYLTHGGLGVIPAFGEKIILKEGDFFSTPSLVKEGKVFARKSRMGLGEEPQYANILDLLKMENIRLYPSAKNVVIEKARLKKGEVEIPNIGSTEIESVRKIPKEEAEFIIKKRFRTIIEGEPVEIAYVKKISKSMKGKKVIQLEPIKGVIFEKESTGTKGRTIYDPKKPLPEKISEEFFANTYGEIKSGERTIKEKKFFEKKYPKSMKVFNRLIEGEKREIKKIKERPRPTEKILRIPQPQRLDINRNLKRELGLREPLRNLRIDRKGSDLTFPRESPRTLEREIPREPTRDIPRDILREIPREPSRNPPRTPARFPPRRPIEEPPKQPPIFKLRGRKAEEKQKAGQGYDVFVKEPKFKKYVKITKKPVARKEALDTREFFIDQTTSRQGYIKRTKQKVNPLMYNIPRGYSENVKQKFRQFRQKKGKRIALTNRVIEKNPYLLDTRSEVKQISIFKKMAEVEKKIQKKLNKNELIGLQFA